MKTCPYCAEAVQDAAILCKHCGRDLAPSFGAPPTGAPPTGAAAPARPYQARHLALTAGAALLLGGGGVAAARRAPGWLTPTVAVAAADSGTARPDADSADVAAAPLAPPDAGTGTLVARREAPPPPPPKPEVFALVSESAVEVGPEQWLDYGFSVDVADGARPCRLTGRVLGLTGGNKDVEVYVLTGDDYLNWRNHPDANVWRAAGVFGSPRQTATALDVALPGAGEYHLVVSNRFSVATAKNVQAEARVTCGPGTAFAAGS